MNHILSGGRVLKIAVALCVYAVVTYFFLFYESSASRAYGEHDTIESIITRSHGMWYEPLWWQRDARSRALYKLWKSYDFEPMQPRDQAWGPSSPILSDLRMLLSSPRVQTHVPVLGCVDVRDGLAAVDTAPLTSTCFGSDNRRSSYPAVNNRSSGKSAVDYSNTDSVFPAIVVFREIDTDAIQCLDFATIYQYYDRLIQTFRRVLARQQSAILVWECPHLSAEMNAEMVLLHHQLMLKFLSAKLGVVVIQTSSHSGLQPHSHSTEDDIGAYKPGGLVYDIFRQLLLVNEYHSRKSRTLANEPKQYQT